jgi:hypothetical protein
LELLQPFLLQENHLDKGIFQGASRPARTLKAFPGMAVDLRKAPALCQSLYRRLSF